MIPDHAPQEIIPIFLHSFLDEYGPSSPIHYTNVFFHAELDLSIGLPPITAVFEIQAHAVTRIIRLLNFFAPILGSPCYAQSSIIFSELNFHQESLVGLLVQGILGHLAHQNRIICESEENYS